MLEAFDALIGTWATKATRPLVDEVVPGTVVEWAESGHFLIQRFRSDDERLPDGISVIGSLRERRRVGNGSTTQVGLPRPDGNELGFGSPPRGSWA